MFPYFFYLASQSIWNLQKNTTHENGIDSAFNAVAHACMLCTETHALLVCTMHTSSVQHITLRNGLLKSLKKAAKLHIITMSETKFKSSINIGKTW